MRPAQLALVMGIAAGLCPAEDDAEWRWELLMRARRQMVEGMKRMPNYTCTERISRRVFSDVTLNCESVDRVKLAVAVIGGHEYFAWPTDAPFDRQNPADIVGLGSAVNTGDFSGFTRTIFSSDAATFTLGPTETHIGKPVVRFDYHVPKQRSAYLMRTESDEAFIGFRGSFWVDPENAHVTTLKVQAEDLPETAPFSEATTVIDFGLKQLGTEEYSFPVASDFFAKSSRDAREFRNDIQFSDCRRYAGESKLMFGAGQEADPGELAQQQTVQLPSGVKLEVTLDTPLDLRSSAAGDVISATVIKPARAGAQLIPKGAKLSGRLVRFTVSYKELRTVAVLHFYTLQMGDRTVPFYGRLKDAGKLKGVVVGKPLAGKSLTSAELSRAAVQDWRSSAMIQMYDTVSRIEPGFGMVWETVSPPAIR